MPQFVQSVANQQMPPPYYFPNVTAYSFAFDISMETVQDYCNTYFNLGNPSDRGFMYRSLPIFPFGMLMVIEYPRMITKERAVLDQMVPFLERGYATQNEVFVTFPVVRHGTRLGNFLVNAAVEWTLPFIAVDNSTSAFSGREILGLDKLYADIALGSSAFPESFSAHVSIPGWPSLNPDVLQEKLDFLSIATGPPTPYPSNSPQVTSPWTVLGSKFARGTVERLAAAVDGLDTISAGLLPTQMHLVALKQFRDAQDPQKAVYQALVGARSRYSNIKNLQIYNEKDVSITFHDNGSLSEIVRVILGASAKSSADAPIQLVTTAAFSFQTDIDFDSMRTMHTYPTDGHGPGGQPRPANRGVISPFLRPWAGFWGPGRKSDSSFGKGRYL